MDTLRLADFTHSELLRHRAYDAIRWISCAADQSRNGSITETFLARFPNAPNRDLIARWWQKAAVGSAPSAWGSSVMSPPAVMTAILDLSRPYSVLDRLVTLGARKVPINVAVAAAVTGFSNFVWAGHGKAKPLNSEALATVTVPPASVAGVVAASNELFRFAPGAMEELIALLTTGAANYLNGQLVDPANAGSTDPFKPRSLTNIASPAVATSTGDVEADLRTLLQAYVAAGGAMSTAVILISSANAAALAARSGAGTGPEFPNLTVSGGVLAGCPCVASDALADQLVILDVKRLAIADPAELDVSVSMQTALEMSSTPTADGGVGTGAILYSLWQNNCTGILVERHISWGYSGPIAMINGVAYLSEGGTPA